MSNQQLQFFGPDFGRGPFTPHRLETAAVQIATALAQLRAPLARSDSDILAHADFIRQLADRLAPDYAAQVILDVGNESLDSVVTTIRTGLGTYSLLRCWLADSIGGGETAVSPTSVTWGAGAIVLQTVTANRHYLVLTPTTGVVTATVNYGGVRNWYWSVSRYARVFYSSQVKFT